MPRRKKTDGINEGLEFDRIFGTFHAESIEQDKEPLFKIVTVSDDYAQPCHYCGEQPALHIANFKDTKKYPNNVYICCSHCSNCDGKWYYDKESAISEWNNRNLGSKPRDKSKKDMYDFVADIIKDFKIRD